MSSNQNRGSKLKRVALVILVLAAVNAGLHVVFAGMTEEEGAYAVSHRGAAALAPENTLAAVAAGVASGAPYVEIDVRATSDGALAVMHDSTVDRTTDGKGKVGELAWDYVKTLDAGGGFSPEFKGEPVPNLASVLRYMKGKGSALVVEAKWPRDWPGGDKTFFDTLREHGMERRVVVISFDTGWIKGLTRMLPNTSLGLLYIYPYSVPPAGEVEYVSIFWPSLVLDPSLAWRMKRAGHTVWAWNVNSEILARFLAWKGVEGITIDDPGVMNRRW
ncbi:MAG TPA: glycerophosphodiester phosphodiesterase family protein [Thermodesulfobacteriota bacterium]|nr:glycerophosphodiester phosphodiesterase family protein [Thermodesulfobacteriota bacterium]